MAKMLVEDKRCSGCKACELVCSLAKLMENNPTKGAIRINGEFPIPGVYHVNFCDQCGDCSNICPTSALFFDKGIVKLNKELCTECGLCFEVCPKKVLFMDVDSRLPLKCDWCGDCSVVCPHGAINFEKEG